MLTEERLSMILEENRAKSFKHWPFSSKQKCNIQNMAEAGFFWTGKKTEPDSAQCFVCNKQLDGWDATDDPWAEHRSHSPKCDFVAIGKPEEDLTIEQLLGVWVSGIKHLCEIYYINNSKALMEQSNMFREHLKNMCLLDQSKSHFE